MTARALIAAGMLLLAPAVLADEIFYIGVSISLFGFTVESTGNVSYEVTMWPFAYSVTGAHSLNDGATGTIRRASFGPTSGASYVSVYNGTLSAGTIYDHCYRATITATGSGGASNSAGSGQTCAPPKPQPKPQPVLNPESPIVLNLAGGDYRFTTVDDGVLFDIRNEGRMVPVAWTEPGSDLAFLALDRDGNGRIEDGGELFGNNTRLTSGSVAANGFEVLAELDENGDGVMNGLDPKWGELLLWNDRDHNGRSDEGELMPVAASGITLLGTSAQVVGRRDQHGNELLYRSHFSVDAARRPYYDVFLATQ